MSFGTLSVSDLLANQATIAQIGEDNAFAAIDAALLAHNTLLREKTADLVEITSDVQRRYGGPDSMTMDDLDEYGTPDAQKVSAGVTLGFPLRKKGIALQWTRDYMEQNTAAELAAQFTSAQDADVRAVDLAIRNAIFGPTNYTWVDRFVNNAISLGVKAFVNADSAAIPLGPNGETFTASTHTHYTAVSSAGSPTAAEYTALVTNVTEHYRTGSAYLYINQGQETAFRALSGFTPYYDSRLNLATTTTYARGGLDMTNIYDRAIGIFSQAEVWVRPWCPSGYAFAFVSGGGLPKPLCLRERRTGTFGLRLVSDLELYPLRARALINEYGVGVWQRTQGAVLYTGGTSYSAPTLT
jgi:hypothetical protein